MQKTIAREDYPLVHTRRGPVRGLELDGVLTFRGIPYARAERFGVPQPCESWSEPLDCYVWGDTCPNPEVPLTTLFSTHRYWIQSENCLNLNVWTTTLDPQARLPVMFWIHGGGYFSGSAIDEAITEGDALAATGQAVVVSVNHRLNCLGFLDLTDCGEAFAHSANAGLEDLIAALTWVRRNIAAFGGDAENVTVFGPSGGGGKILSLMQMPAADGLYHKAIIQSGVMPNHEIYRRGAEHGRLTLRQLGLTPETAAQARQVPYAALYEAAERAAREMGSLFRDVGGPHPDGAALLDDYKTAGFRAETAGVPVLVGTCAAEASLFSPEGLKKPLFSASDIKALSAEQKLARLRARYGEAAEAIAAAWQNTYPQLDVLYALNLDVHTRQNSLDYARARADFAAAPVYNYLFTYLIPVLEGKLAWHGADLGFTFGNLAKSEVLRAGEDAWPLMEKMRDAWLAFARTGSPAHPGLPAWTPYSAARPATMLLGSECALAEGHDTELLRLLAEHSPKL